MLAFLGLVKKHDLIYNLLIMINNKGTYTGGASRYENQSKTVITKFGQTRLRSLELIHAVLQLLHPTLGVLAAANLTLTGQINPDADTPENI